MGGVGIWGVGVMWVPSRRCGYDRDDGDNMWRPQTMETSWGPSGGYGDNMRTTGTMGMMGMMWRQHGDDVGMTGTMWG